MPLELPPIPIWILRTSLAMYLGDRFGEKTRSAILMAPEAKLRELNDRLVEVAAVEEAARHA